MEYKVADIVREINIALDKNMSSEALSNLGDVDTLTLDEIIASKIEDAARTVTLNAPYTLLDGGKAFGDVVGWDMQAGYGPGRIVLPDDFLRLLVFQMSDWSRPVTEPITEDDARYALQRSRFPGVRGCPQSPVVALAKQPVGLVLEFYSCTQGENVYVKMARYVPIPKKFIYEGEARIDLCEKLLRPIIYYAAYLVAISIDNATQAVSLRRQSYELMGMTDGSSTEG
ncbi:MAG: hypothetical protein IJ197_08730 [Bacteroidaceae bacterium]|nr:hypothetical protein [Bacteroidaceae bacterium]